MVGPFLTRKGLHSPAPRAHGCNDALSFLKKERTVSALDRRETG